jgi:hypothetical protein
MEKFLQIIAVLAMISSIFVLARCISQLLNDAPEVKYASGPSIRDRFLEIVEHSEKNNQVATPPLVRQAEAFAMYLNPPEPPKSSETEVSSSSRQTISRINPVELSPKFTLTATSYYRSKPQASMALVWEPGIGFHWIKQGSKLGHFIIDKIERGTVVYRNGSLQGKMSVDTKVPIYTEKTHEATSVSTETRISPAGSSILPKRETKTDDLGLPNQEAQSIVQDNEIGGIG